MKTSFLFMLIIQGAVAIITGILYHKVLTVGKKEKGKEEETEENR